MNEQGNSRKIVAALLACALMLAGTPGSAAAADSEVNEYLDMDITQLMNITVTSVTKREQRLSDAAAVFVISQEDIR